MREITVSYIYYKLNWPKSKLEKGFGTRFLWSIWEREKEAKKAS